jgi:phosphatidylserine decarboxylase
MSSITRFLPKNHLSYFMGLLVHIEWPPFLNQFIIANFAKAYKIDLTEAEFEISQYKSLGDFFVRRLKPGLRPLGSTWAVHPADAVITQAAKIREGRLIQAKNKTYSVQTFTQDQKALEKWQNACFLTYYLCPTDYHRVHSPVTGEIKRVVHIPGTLWPVNAWSTENINEIFSVNERVLVEIQTEKGLVGVMFVGATNVGQIILSFDSEIRGNQLQAGTPIEKTDQNILIQKGQELGQFRMGSTVVMLYSEETLPSALDFSRFLNQPVKVNSAFT